MWRLKQSGFISFHTISATLEICTRGDCCVLVCVRRCEPEWLQVPTKFKYKDKHHVEKYKPRDQCKRNKLAVMPLCGDSPQAITI